MNIQFEKPYKCMVPIEPLHIVVVGVGGTGGHLAPQLARMMWMERENGRPVHMTFVDPGLIEEKNIGRQNFCPPSIGQYKAIDLALRFNVAYGLKIQAIPEKFDPAMVEDVALIHGRLTTLIIDCVDNPEARQAINKVELGKRIWLLSSGNAASNGQVMIGNAQQTPDANADAFGFCQYLPSPYIMEPELLTARPEDGQKMAEKGARTLMSCADLTAAGLQERMVNVHAAAHAAVIVDNFIKGQFAYCAVRFNIDPPAVQRIDITKSNMGAWLGFSD
ncbi:MAG: ThiF family adenylyltransferase [Chloroflexota bacterium]